MTALNSRPTVGRLVVPYMVDATRTPIDFKIVDPDHVRQCAERGRCGICGSKIKRGPIAFIGPAHDQHDQLRTCFADPWMHLDCARLALEQCPFLGGRRDWREGGDDPLLAGYEPGAMVITLAHAWRSHLDPFGHWHFEAVGLVARA